MKKQQQLYSGKAKSVYEANEPGKCILEYRDDATAFNALKAASLAGKGRVNNLFNAFIMQTLHANNIQTHFISCLNDTESVVHALKMLPVECVVRNYAAGSIVKRLGLTRGSCFNSPIFEFFYKDDDLGDPMVNESHILTFNWATQEQIAEMKKMTFRVNEVLTRLFDRAGMILVDYKLEFGILEGDVTLGDEFTPDGCRLWDKETGRVMDKDRFREDMGDVIETYEEVARRIGVQL